MFTDASGRWVILRRLLPMLLLCSVGAPTHAQNAESKYIVDGLALGDFVHTSSNVYKQYHCRGSEQFNGYTFCQRKKQESRSGATLSITTTIIHDESGRVAYVNEFVSPAEFTDQSVAAEIDRLSAKMGDKAKVRRTPDRPESPKAVMAVWGNLSLQELTGSNLDVVRSGRSPNKGILADYIADFTGSAAKSLAVYSMPSGQGFAWIANFGSSGRGSLRFFAIDADALSRARAPAKPQQAPPAPSVENDRKMRGQQELAELKSLLDNCGVSCPANPEADLARREVINLIDRDKLIASEATEFVAASRDADALKNYLANCKICAFQQDAKDTIKDLTSSREAAGREDLEFNAAGDDLGLLRKYAANCSACSHLQDAVEKIGRLNDSASDDFPEVRVCNNDHIAVYVASVGKRGPGLANLSAFGWTMVATGACVSIGRFAQGEVMLTATNRNGIWPSKDDTNIRYCGSSAPFARAVIDHDICPSDEKLFGFRTIDVPRSGYTWTLNPTSWTFSAVAYSPDSNNWGFATGWASAEEASDSALSSCSENASDCVQGTWARNDLCLALAQGQGGGLGWSSGSTPSEARHRAIAECANAGNESCAVIRSSCN